MTAREAGGRLWKVEKARVGMVLCMVDVRGDACMCKSRLGDTVEVGAGKRDAMGVSPE